MAKEFKNPNDLFNFLSKHIQSTLRNEAAQLIIETEQRHIQDDVYDVYEPQNPYGRRMYNDGLIDEKNIEVSILNGDTISVENIAYDGDRNVPYIVESGEGYFAGASPVLTNGRKFTKGTVEELRSSNALRNTMKSGLIKRGIKAE